MPIFNNQANDICCTCFIAVYRIDFSCCDTNKPITASLGLSIFVHFGSDIHFALEYKYHLLSWLSNLTATNSNNFELGKRLHSISQYEVSVKYLHYLLHLIFHLFILEDEEVALHLSKQKT